MRAVEVARCTGGLAAAAVVGVLCGSLLAVVAGGPIGLAGADTITAETHPLLVRGTVGGLTPGTQTTVEVEVSNPNPGAMELQRVTVVAGDASPTCRAGNLSVGGYDAGAQDAPVHALPGGGATVVSLVIELARSATPSPDACQDVTFPLRYTVTAIGRDR